jgi:hypothetical protein
LIERALNIFREMLGDDHPATEIVANNLDSVRHNLEI